MLEGLAVALSNVDEIIALIKAAPTPAEAKAALMAQDVALAAGRGHAEARRGATPRGRKAWRRNSAGRSERTATGCPTRRRRRSSSCGCSA